MRTSSVSAEPAGPGYFLLTLPQVPEVRGNLTALEELAQLPFRFGRVRWFYDITGGSRWPRTEAGREDVLVVALSGSFDVVVGGRRSSARVHLGRASIGLHVSAPSEWRIDGASTNSVGLLISSQHSRPVRSAATQRAERARDAPYLSTTVEDCHTLALGRRRRGRTSITDAVPNVDVPFAIPRVYYLYDIPSGASRGGHAHRELEQVLVAVAGSFDVQLNDGDRDRMIRLDRAYTGAYIAPGIWRELRNFSSGAICLTLASAPYEEADYIRAYNEFRREKRVRRSQ